MLHCLPIEQFRRRLRNFKGSLSISVGVQEMVRSDIGSSGVAFTLDTESGYRGSILSLLRMV